SKAVPAPRKRVCAPPCAPHSKRSAVANAIYKSEPGDTLRGIAEQYYAVRRPEGAVRKVELANVVSAIRRATAKTVNSSLSTEQALRAGTTLAILCIANWQITRLSGSGTTLDSDSATCTNR